MLQESHKLKMLLLVLVAIGVYLFTFLHVFTPSAFSAMTDETRFCLL